MPTVYTYFRTGIGKVPKFLESLPKTPTLISKRKIQF